MGTEITVKNFYKQKLSVLIMLVIADVARIKACGFGLNMDNFVTKNSETCSACLGGMALLGLKQEDCPLEKRKTADGSIDVLTTYLTRGEILRKKLLNYAFAYDTLRNGYYGSFMMYLDKVLEKPIPSDIKDSISDNFELKLSEKNLLEAFRHGFRGTQTGAQTKILLRILAILAKEVKKAGY